MTTQAQIDANRKNAQASTGARTAAGREASKANSCKHGMSGKGLVLAAVQAEAVAERADFWVARIGAVTDADRELAGQIALEEVRVAHCQQMESDLLHDQARRAADHWDADQAKAASDIARKIRREPESVTHELERTTHGCALKIKRWDGLLRFLRNGKPWDAPRCEVAQDLLGVIPELRHPDYLPFGDTADEQAELASEEIARLETLQAESLDELSLRRREQAIAGHAFPDKNVWLVRRYESACTRRLDAHLKKLVGRKLFPVNKPASPNTKSINIDLVEPEPIVFPKAEEEFASWLGELQDAPSVMTLEEALAHLNAPMPTNPLTDEEEDELAARDALAWEIVERAQATGQPLESTRV